MIEFVKADVQGDLSSAEKIAKTLGIAPLAAKLLCMRKQDTVEKARAFLNPSIDMLHDPFLFDEMQTAVDCINEYIFSQQKICVYGDYDVDGIMSVAIMTKYLTDIGANVMNYIPSRYEEGYGLNNAALDKLKENGAALIITVDCGITALAEVKHARQLGMEVIITDHHQMLNELPECVAIINPLQKCYPFDYLCGAGVALKVVQALGGIEAASPYFDLAAIATIADIVELCGENRIIVAHGLERINSASCSLGVAQLALVAGYSERVIDESAVAFAISPRINAAGRTNNARMSLELFLSTDKTSALKIAQQLDKQNKNRQEIESAIFMQAIAKIEEGEINIAKDRAIILKDERWSSGVIGIVASRLVEKFNKPVILFAQTAEYCTGSGRSIAGINMFESLCQTPELFEKFGGHVMAAGLTMKTENFDKFRALFCQIVEKAQPIEMPPKASYDSSITPEEISIDLIGGIDALAPYGAGNPLPVFLLHDIKPALVRTMGSDKQHLKFSLHNQLDIVAFGAGDRAKQISENRLDILCNLNINTWNNKQTPQGMARKIKAMPIFQPQATLQDNEWKFYDAFFEQMSYNNIADATGMSGEVQGIENPETFIMEWLAKAIRGLAVLCNTPQGAQDFLELINRNGWEEKIDVSIQTFKGECAYNAAILAPNYEKLDLSNYLCVLVWDDFLSAYASEQVCGRIIKHDKNVKIYTAKRDCGEFLRSACFDRQTLAPVFKKIVGVSIKQTNFLDIERYFLSFGELAQNQKNIIVFALRVFNELGFIRCATGATFAVALQKDYQKKELSMSTLYNAVWLCAESYHKNIEVNHYE